VDSCGPGQGPVAGSCKYGDEPSGSGAAELVSNNKYRTDARTHDCYLPLTAIIVLDNMRINTSIFCTIAENFSFNMCVTLRDISQ
jgi:hypothetical protein